MIDAGTGVADRTTTAAVSARSDEGPLEPIDLARDRAERERREVNAELRALERFRRRVASIDVPPGAGRARLGGLTADGREDEMERLREAYRETVMSVPHYDRVYSESLERNLRAEFGPDIATCVREGGQTAFTPPFKRALLAAIERNVADRDRFLDVLGREIDSLARAQTVLSDVVERLSTTDPADAKCDGSADRLRELSGRIDSVAADRQRIVHDRVSTGRADGHALCEYLYDETSWTYPVLSVVASLRRELGRFG